MKHGFIAPIEYLHLIPEECDFHLTLAHLFENEKYTEFYKNRKVKGDFIIVDNSAFEFKEALSKEFLLSIFQKIPFIPDVIVLPDYPFEDYQKTVDSAYESVEYFKANYPSVSFMVVPQSKKGDLEGWIKGYKMLASIKDVSFIGLSILGVPNAFCEITGTEDISFNRMYALSYLYNSNIVNYSIKHHCLGLGSNIRELLCMKQFPFVYSNDSSSAFWHAINGVRFDNSASGLFLGKIKKEVDFYYPYSESVLSDVKYNINYFNQFLK